ncbi:DNA-binding protein [Parathermosynechococcus lividus]
MKSAILTVLLSTTALVGTSIAQAQVPIRNLQRNPGISISGVIRSVVGNDFVLDDGTGQIIVDAGPRWYHQLNLTPGERVTVVGKYDDEDFDAYTITRNGGEVIKIRDAGGPPPWAGGRGRRGR